MLPNLQAYINRTESIDFQGHSFMTEIATIDWFRRWGTSVFSENTAIFILHLLFIMSDILLHTYVSYSTSLSVEESVSFYEMD